jgi:osmotically-inducible protein OsmY
VSASHKTGDLAGKASRDLRNRAQGLIAEARSKFSSETVSDEVLIERVRAELGRHPVHQRALQITAYQGEVRLSGPALASEVEEIVKAVSAVRGVEGVDNQLEVHEQAGSISSLQGEVRQPLAS